jgi:hypothetical protein
MLIERIFYKKHYTAFAKFLNQEDNKDRDLPIDDSCKPRSVDTKNPLDIRSLNPRKYFYFFPQHDLKIYDSKKDNELITVVDALIVLYKGNFNNIKIPYFMLTTEYFTPSRIVEILRNELQYIEMSMSDLKEKYHDPKKYKELSKKLNKYLKKLNQLKEQYPEEFI